MAKRYCVAVQKLLVGYLLLLSKTKFKLRRKEFCHQPRFQSVIVSELEMQPPVFNKKSSITPVFIGLLLSFVRKFIIFMAFCAVK